MEPHPGAEPIQQCQRISESLLKRGIKNQFTFDASKKRKIWNPPSLRGFMKNVQFGNLCLSFKTFSYQSQHLGTPRFQGLWEVPFIYRERRTT